MNLMVLGEHKFRVKTNRGNMFERFAIRHFYGGFLYGKMAAWGNEKTENFFFFFGGPLNV